MNSSEKTPAAPTDPHDPTLQNTNLEELPADVKEGIHNVDQDDAVDLFAGTEEIFGYTDKEATRVRWKLDLILLSTVGHCMIALGLVLLTELDDPHLYILVYR
jgi:hypothetical protein